MKNFTKQTAELTSGAIVDDFFELVLNDAGEEIGCIWLIDDNDNGAENWGAESAEGASWDMIESREDAIAMVKDNS